ncbi:hypothetical protein DXG01_017123 [Tephrocybe rancida]|nr:hypothetical protein DXG01_017123 [Tephrocybe rancida]
MFEEKEAEELSTDTLVETPITVLLKLLNCIDLETLFKMAKTKNIVSDIVEELQQMQVTNLKQNKQKHGMYEEHCFYCHSLT